MLETERLGLRLLTITDIEHLEALDSDPEVKKYFPSGGHKSRLETETMIKKFIGFHTELGLPGFVIFEKETGNFVGRCGFGVMDDDEIEVGYVLHKTFWGKGYATEVLNVVLEWARSNIKSDYIIALAVVDNNASLRVMQKCGMQYYKTDVAKGDTCIYYRIPNR